MESTETKPFDIKALKGAGQPERHDFSSQKPAAVEDTSGAAASTAAADVTETPEAKLAREQAAAALAEIKLPELSDEQLKKLFADKGIEGFESFDKLKEKIAKADAPVTLEPTEEEKKAAQLAEDTILLNRFIQSGGTAEGYVALKKIATMDLRELSVAELKEELKKKNLNEDEINAVIKERYYQLNPDELKKEKRVNEDDEIVEETDEEFEKRKEFLKKKIAAFADKLDNRSINTKKNAETILNNLRESIKEEDSKKIQESQILSKVDEISKSLPRELTFELGEVNKTKIDPVVYKVTEADIEAVAAEFKDSTQRQKILLNEDKTLNLTNLIDLKLRNRILTSALKAAYIEGGNREVAKFEKVFPGSAKALGVGGSQGAASTTGRKGVIASAGQPEVARPTT